ncbi:iron-sulfur cluster repair di-iron protein, ric [Erysipelothrix urinaevulpis]|uniref:iron-sulfur cluster repair di-iron protein, ric n=1 Tax=Erysipelothrix urinaevulpis TaxID=2683717 RepID=UPI001357ABA9|nr:iron-sulfur cluster repair di-iron protein, ric [Erysipelothrix urinaevulpis]
MKKYFETNKEILDLYTNALTKAHAKNHPEVIELRHLFKELERNIDDEEQFLKTLDTINFSTNNFKVPEDVCDTYKKTYQMLEQLYKKGENK